MPGYPTAALLGAIGLTSSQMYGYNMLRSTGACRGAGSPPSSKLSEAPPAVEVVRLDYGRRGRKAAAALSGGFTVSWRRRLTPAVVEPRTAKPPPPGHGRHVGGVGWRQPASLRACMNASTAAGLCYRRIGPGWLSGDVIPHVTTIPAAAGCFFAWPSGKFCVFALC
jgi:hypothetical protein